MALPFTFYLLRGSPFQAEDTASKKFWKIVKESYYARSTFHNPIADRPVVSLLS